MQREMPNTGATAMRLTALSVTNYRALRDVTLPLSRFGCLIGENNAGKSTCLQALALFFSGNKLATGNFFDDTTESRIAVTFEDITVEDMARLAEEHRARVAAIVKQGRLTLVRNYDTSGKSSLLFSTLAPSDVRFSQESIAELVKGQRAGTAFADKVLRAFPELAGKVDASMNQDTVKDKIQSLADSLPDEAKVSTDQPLPTGIDKSIIPMLPEPIYIPAVKDLADDIKTTESTPFGKILAILLRAVEAKLPDAAQLFADLNAKLNRTKQADGTEVDDRLDEIKLIESTVERYVQESFASVALRIAIPPPELKAVFSSARIFANDGVDGIIDSKGDGLRRAVVFSVLRAYVELKAKLAPKDAAIGDGAQPVPSPSSYLLLFEEPELFLHPKAQHILFDALRVFSNEHHVLVTTHSPTFFGPNATGTFVKLRKHADAGIAPRPFTVALPVDLTELTARDQFQLICFENNNAAFFADTVVLVEGDSDYLLMRHIARTLNPLWDVSRLPLVFARLTGKGNIRRYREFFRKFGVRVPVIADLDLLVSGFDHISPSKELNDARSELLALVDKHVVPDEGGHSSKAAKDAHASGELKGLWRRVRDGEAEVKAGTCTQAEYDARVEAFFGWQRKDERLSVLMTSDDPRIVESKRSLLGLLRAVDTYVLERGAIEQYYPQSVSGVDKPSRAQDFCEKVATRDEILACCGEVVVVRDGVPTTGKEFDVIFDRLFAPHLA
jgi:putative ATP-dependent endonuclease of OLD family